MKLMNHYINLSELLQDTNNSMRKEISILKEKEALLKNVLYMWKIEYENTSMATGVCCCGNDMTNHGSAMDCGHEPLDSGLNYGYELMDLTIKALEEN